MQTTLSAKNANAPVYARICNGAEAFLPWKLLRTYLESCASIMQLVVWRPLLLPLLLSRLSHPTLFVQEIRPNPRWLVKRSPLRCRTNITRSSVLVQASSSLLITELTRHRNTFSPFFTRVSQEDYFRHFSCMCRKVDSKIGQEATAREEEQETKLRRLMKVTGEFQYVKLCVSVMYRERLFLLHNCTDLWCRITPYGLRCRYKAFRIIWRADLLVKKKERDESMCMCMRIYMCDIWHRIHSIYVYRRFHCVSWRFVVTSITVTIVTLLLRWPSYCVCTSNHQEITLVYICRLILNDI